MKFIYRYRFNREKSIEKGVESREKIICGLLGIILLRYMVPSIIFLRIFEFGDDFGGEISCFKIEFFYLRYTEVNLMN